MRKEECISKVIVWSMAKENLKIKGFSVFTAVVQPLAEVQIGPCPSKNY